MPNTSLPSKLSFITDVSNYLKEHLRQFSHEDTIHFNNKLLPIAQSSFKNIIPSDTSGEHKKITFIDGGQAEIISTGNFCLSYIRVCALTFLGKKKSTLIKKEFYLLTTARYLDADLCYESKIFGDRLFDEHDLSISSADETIRHGLERAPISMISNMARRFAELSLSKSTISDYFILDGSLDVHYRNEEKYLFPKLSALAKSCSLFTTAGNNPAVLLNKLGPFRCWYYSLEKNTFFVKLHESSRHVFRFEGDIGVLPFLCTHSSDPTFLGYPYGLMLVDKLARVSNEEKRSLRFKFLLDKQNKEIIAYLSTLNAHDILDRLG